MKKIPRLQSLCAASLCLLVLLHPQKNSLPLYTVQLLIPLLIPLPVWRLPKTNMARAANQAISYVNEEGQIFS